MIERAFQPGFWGAVAIKRSIIPLYAPVIGCPETAIPPEAIVEETL